MQALHVRGPAGTEQEEGAQLRVSAETVVLQTLQTEADASFSNVQAAQLIFAGHSGSFHVVLVGPGLAGFFQVSSKRGEPRMRYDKSELPGASEFGVFKCAASG